MMKKLITVLIAAALLLTLAGCGSGSSSGLPEIKILGDAFELGAENGMWAYNEDRFVYAADNEPYMFRVTAKLPSDVYDEIEAIDFFDEDHEQKMFEILAPLTVDKVEDLSKGKPSQAELDKLIGSSGADLLAAGYEIDGWSGWDGEVHYSLSKGDFEYEFTMAEKADMEADGFDGEMAFPDFTVKSVEYFGLSYRATDID